jgi:YD repeat-containing protein
VVPPPLSHRFAWRAIVAAQVASLAIVAAAAAVLAGWLLDIPRLTSLYLPGPTVKTNAALCLLCAALANLTLISAEGRGPAWRIVGRVLAAIPALVGALTLSEHIVGWDVGIDQLLAREPAGALATMSPNRMGPPGSLGNLLLGTALLLRDSPSARRRTVGHVLTLLACVIAVLPLMGYANGFTQLYGLARYTGIALVTAVALFTLAIAIQAGHPESGLVSLVCRGDEVGVFARGLLPAAILLPFGIGWLLARLLGAGIVDAAFAISAMALVLMIALVGVIWRTGTQLVLSLDARAATERALAESERTLREADHQKTEFLATLSHELRNPLAPIRFAVELLNGPPSSAERARQTIARQVHHLTRLIDDLLDLTRITRNKLQLHRRPCDLRQLVTDAVDAVSTDIARARHDLSIEMPPDAVALHADPDRVVQMLVNLLTNAIRYSEPGGRIRIRATLDGSHATIAVLDTGHGIDGADLDRVFERFVQVGSSTHGGLGIGLALVKALAELHGGSVEAQSEGLGRGAEFRVRLPRATTLPATAPAGARPSVESCRILVVDDNRDAADMLAGLLTAEGHQVRVAYDGEGALRVASAFKPQIGFLDIGMAGMDGYEVAARLRGDAQVPDLFLVAITGWGQADDRRRALSAGFDAHLTKPASPDEIAALLASRWPADQADATPLEEPSA